METGDKNRVDFHCMQISRVMSMRYISAMTAMTTASGNVASKSEPLDGSLWWYWIGANAAKKTGACFKITIDLVICSVFVECRKDKVFSVICEISLKANKSQIIHNFVRFGIRG